MPRAKPGLCHTSADDCAGVGALCFTIHKGIIIVFERRSSAEHLSTFALWGAWVGVAFFGVYPTTNWMTGLRHAHYALFLDAELNVPFVPQFIWLYLSMYVLFAMPLFFLSPTEMKRLAKQLITATCIGGISFLLLPARLGFERVLPADPFYQSLFEQLFAVDRPFNLVPSLHVVYSVAIALAVAARAARHTRFIILAWLVLIVVSTVLVHQHHILDVLTGVALALLMRSYWREDHA